MIILGCEMVVPPFKQSPSCRDSLAFTTDGFLLVAPLTQDSRWLVFSLEKENILNLASNPIIF